MGSEFPARQRPDRPIPTGVVDTREAFVVGSGLLATSIALVTLAGARRGNALEGLVGAVALAAAIVVYDAWHKGNPVAPVLMGLCRALVYVVAALALARGLPTSAMLGAVAMFSYTAGLSEVARSERAPAHGIVALAVAPLVLAAASTQSASPVAGIAVALVLAAVVAAAVLRSRARASESATVLLLGGLSLVDAALLASHGYVALAVVAVLAMPLTRRLQRFVRGT